MSTKDQSAEKMTHPPSCCPCSPPEGPVVQQQQQVNGGGDVQIGYFWDHYHGIYFTYTTYQMKQAMCRLVIHVFLAKKDIVSRYLLLLSLFAHRALLKFLLLSIIFLVFYLAWEVCDYCIFFTALGSCGGSFAGLKFLSVPCWAGVVSCLLRGFTIGNEIAQVQVHWKI